jgi:hypothetical protein
MNAHKLVLLVLVLALLPLLSASALAEVTTLNPTTVVMGPATERGETTVLVQFDLSAAPDLKGFDIDEALVEWPVAGLPADWPTEYALYPVTSAWSAAALASTGLPARAEIPAASWSWGALPAQWNGTGRLRFDITPLFRDWVEGRSANHGFVITTADVDDEVFASRLGTMSLTLRYGRHPR